MPIKINLPDITETERTPLVDRLLGMIEQLVQENSRQAETIQQLRDEITILKGEKPKPQFKPSGMNENAGAGSDDEGDGQGDDSPGADDAPKKRAGSEKRAKKKNLPIHETKIIAPSEPVPAGSVIKGHADFVVQDIRLEAYNIRYRREIWLTPDGRWLRGELPSYQQG